ncbi:hypothetical protein Bca4012_010650 [Brassica carinata]
MYFLLGFYSIFIHAMGKFSSLVSYCWYSFGFCADRDNVSAGKKEDRMMMTILHTVIFTLLKCGSYVGWRYVRRKHF